MLVGEASIRITADVRNLAQSVEDKLSRLDRVGQSVGRNVGQSIRDGINQGFADGAKDMTPAMERKGREAGKAFGESFVDEAAFHITGLPNRISGGDLGRAIATQSNQGFADELDFSQAISNQATRVGDSGRTQGQQWAQNFNQGTRSVPIVPPRIPPGDYGGAGGRAGGEFGRGFTNAFDGWMASRGQGPFENMIRGLIENAIQLGTIGNVIYGVVGAVSSLISAVFALGSQMIATIPAALSLGNVLASVFQGGIVMKSLFGGVGEGISALTKAQTAQTKAVTGTQEATQKAAAAAKKSALDELERLLRIREARDALSDAILGQSRSREDAAERISDAEESLSDAIRDEERAQQAIGEARDAARERLEDLRLELDRASLTEERAALNLAKAEKALADARAGGNLNAIYEADLAYREQAQSLTEIQERNADLADEQAQAAAEGINGNREVIDAKEAHRDAVEAVSDAERDLTRAIEDQPRAAVDAALQVARAQLALKRALEQTKDAITAPIAGGGALGTAMNNLASAYDKLSPAARRFVEYWVGTVRPVLEDIKKAGQEVFFPKLIEAIDILLNSQFDEIIKRMFVDTSAVLGDFVVDLANAFTTPRSLEALGNIFESNVRILESIGEAATNLIEPLLIVFESVAPVAEEFANALKKASENFADFIGEKDRAGEIVPFFETARDRAVQLWETLKSMGRALRLVFENALPAGDSLMAQLQEMYDNWTTLNDTVEGNKAMQNTFQGANDNALSLLSLVGEIGGAFFRMGADSNIGDIADAIKAIIKPLEELGKAGLDQIADSVIRIIGSIPSFAAFFTETGAIETFFNIVSRVFEVLANILDSITGSPTGSWLLGMAGKIFGAFAALQLFSGLLGGVIQKFTNGYRSTKNFFSAVSEGAKTAGRQLKSAYDTLKTFISSLVKNRKSPVALGTAFGDARDKRADIKLGYQVEDFRAEQAKQEKKLLQAGQAIGADFSRGIETGIRQRLAQVGEAGDDVAQALINNTKKKLESSSPSQVAARIGQGFGEGLELGLESSESEVAAAGREIAQALEGAVDTGLEGAGSEAAAEVGREITSGLELAEPKVRGAGAELGNAMETGLDNAVRGAGKQAATATSESLQTGLRTEIPEVRRAGKQLGNAAEQGLDTAVAGAGSQAAEVLSESMQAGMTAEGPELQRKGRWMAMRVKAGVASAGPATVAVAPVGGAGAGALGSTGAATAGAAASAGKLGRFGAIAGKALKPIKFLGTALKFLGKGFLALLGPVGAVIGVAWTVWEVMQMLGISFDDVKNFFTNFPEEISKLWEKVKEYGAEFWDWLVPNGQKIINAISAWWNTSFIPWVQGIPGQIAGFVSGIWNGLVPDGDEVTNAAAEWWDSSFLPWLKSLPGLALEAFVGFWQMVIPGKQAGEEDPVRGVETWFEDTFKPWLLGLPIKIAGFLGNIWGGLLEKAKEAIPLVIEWIDGTLIPWIEELPDLISEKVSGWLDGLVEAAEGVPEMLTTWVTGSLIPWFENLPGLISEKVSGWLDGLVEAAKGVPEMLTTWVTGSLIPWFENLPGMIAGAIGNLWKMIFNNDEEDSGPNAALNGAYDAEVKPFFETLPGKVLILIGKLLLTIAKAFVTILTLPFKILGALLKVAWEALVAFWDVTIKPWITSIPGKIGNWLSKAWNGFVNALATAKTAVTDWWSANFVPWVQSIPNKIAKALGNPWSPLLAGIEGQLAALKTWVTDDFKPWVEGLPAKVAKWLGGLWDALPNGIQDAFISVVKWINKNLLPVLRKLPFVKNLKDLDIPGRADGGPISGPNVGSKADNLLYRLTSGEYVLNRRMVRQAGGFGELERWRRGQGGEKPTQQQGGIVGWLKGWGAKSSKALLELVLGQVESSDDPMIAGAFTWVKTKIFDNIVAWMEKLRPKPATNGTTQGTYRGPADGWTYPLAVRFPSFTFAGHNPWHAYDIRSPEGISVRAVSSGRVTTSADLGYNSYGQFLRVVHADGTSSLYAHLSRRNVGVGQIVKTGQIIGVSGASGGVTGPHLHFELGADDARRMMAARGVRLAEGGVVRATSGGVAALLAEGGRSERVTPLDSQGRSPAEVEMLKIMEQMAAKRQGDTFLINVHPSPGMDERLLAQRVSREIAQTKRRRS